MGLGLGLAGWRLGAVVFGWMVASLNWIGGVGEVVSGWVWVWVKGSKHPGAAVPGVIQRGQERDFGPNGEKLPVLGD